MFGNILKMLFSTTTHTKSTTAQQENYQNTTTHTTTTTKKSEIKGSWVCGSIKITQKIKITHRERSVRGFVALGRRRRVEDRFVVRRLQVAGEVEGSWVEGPGSKIGEVDEVEGVVDEVEGVIGSQIGGFVDRRSRSR